jgi:four helix bundle protein
MVGLKGFEAYQVALAVYRLVLAATRDLPRGAVDQLIRASESVARNIAEAHPQIGAERARKFRIAFGEASECGAAIDLLEIRGALDGRALVELRGLLDRQRAMLWRLSRG